MKRLRVIKLNPVPEVCGGRKPADQITDRALRYRANSDACRPKGAKLCMWCGVDNRHVKGTRPPIEVAHIDGNETNTAPENLAWTCRSCNQKVAVVMKRAGVGRPTNQYNPSKGAKTKEQYAWALAVMRGDEDGDAGEAAQIVLDTPHSKRSDWNVDFWKVRKERYGPSGRKDGGAVPF